MTTPFVGEIRLFAFPRVPDGWFACNGDILPISEYSTLYTLLGTTYGGDGVTTFAVPDLRGRVPLHQGTGYGLTPRVMGEISGTENVTLLSSHMPAHSHTVGATTATAAASAPGPTQLPGTLTGDTMYATDLSGASSSAMAQNEVSTQGANQPHDNLMPTLTVSYCIAWQGVFPSQS